MRWRRLSLLLIALLGCGATSVVAGDAVLPKIDGELVGRLSSVPGAPELKWTVDLVGGRVEAAELVTFRVAVEGEGTHLVVEAGMTSTGWAWRIREATIELAAWQQAAGNMRPELAGWSWSGRVQLEGEGGLREGVPSGWLRLRLTEGRAESAVKKVTVEGIAAEVCVADLATRTTETKQWVSWSGGRLDTIVLGKGRLEFGLEAGTLVVVKTMQEVFGGRVNVQPFRLRPDQSLNGLDARAEGIEVGMVLPLLPPVVAEAKGRLDGVLRLERNEKGLMLAEARLGLPDKQTAQVRLLPTPGIISNNLPKSVLKHYPGLIRIETGEMPMKAERMDVRINPQSATNEKSATIRLEGGPTDPALRAPLVFDVNVFGPLEPLIRFGTDERLRFGK